MGQYGLNFLEAFMSAIRCLSSSNFFRNVAISEKEENYQVINLIYSKTCLSGHSKRRLKLFFKTDYRLMQVKTIFYNTFDLH